MPKLKGKVGDFARYQRSARYFRRRQLAGSKAAWVPPVFGSLTAVIAALADGPARRVNMFGLFPERIFTALPRTDIAGLTTNWNLPSLRTANNNAGLGKGGARRGCALALNPGLPVLNEVRALASRLAKTYDIAIDRDVTADERRHVPANPRFDLFRILGSEPRTKMLLALHCLGGHARASTAYRCVPDVSPGMVKKLVHALHESGILHHAEGEVAFAPVPWRRELRALLGAVCKLEPSFAAGVRRMVLENKERSAGRHTYGLFGKDATQRALFALARYGPMSRTQLAARAQLADEKGILDRFASTGLLVHRTVRHRARIALNPAHPLHDPLRTFLLALQGVTGQVSAQPVDGEPVNALDLAPLFSTQLQLDVLIMLYLAGDDGIDGSDMRRLLPQHNMRNLVDKMWDLCAWGIGVEDPMDFGMIRYRLNPDYGHINGLKELLRQIADRSPTYKRAYALRHRLWPERRATRERNRALEAGLPREKRA